jgi:hypothetical protein
MAQVKIGPEAPRFFADIHQIRVRLDRCLTLCLRVRPRAELALPTLEAVFGAITADREIIARQLLRMNQAISHRDLLVHALAFPGVAQETQHENEHRHDCFPFKDVRVSQGHGFGRR